MRRVLAALGLLALGFVQSAPARADIVIDNLSQPNAGYTQATYIGQSFIDGPGTYILNSATIQLEPGSDTSALTLELESRNADGTDGATVYSNFSSSYNSTTSQVTFTANSTFDLGPNQGYYLVLSDGANDPIWVYNPSTAYDSQDGFTIPSKDVFFISGSDNGGGKPAYLNSGGNVGPLLFSLTVTPTTPAPATVPEPSTLLTSLLGIAVALGTRRLKKRRPAPVA